MIGQYLNGSITVASLQTDKLQKCLQILSLSQSHYSERVLDKFKYLDFNDVKTSIDLSFTFQKNEGES